MQQVIYIGTYYSILENIFIILEKSLLLFSH